MKIKSFRSKIALTLIVVISLISSISFYLYSNYLSKKIYKNTEETTIKVLELFNEPTKISNDTHGIQSYYDLIDKSLKNERVLNSYLLNSDGKIIYPKNNIFYENDSVFISDVKKMSDEITFKTSKTSDNQSFSRAYVKLYNSEKCTKCHELSNRGLGYMIFDFSINQTEQFVSFTRKFSISFTIFMLIIIGGLVIIMHYRFVKKSLTKFKSSIDVINNGNLDERVIINESKELGTLAKSFNEMLDKFRQTKKELEIYNKKELQNAQKLATIGEMSARLAHEIRNPITGIANAIEIIVEESQDEQNIQILEEIRRQANRVNSAVTNLLKYSKKDQYNFKFCNVNKLIKSVSFFIQSQVVNKDITFETELDEKIPKMVLDCEQIENAIINLSLNAVQAIKHTGKIIYRTKLCEDKKSVIIEVEDTGEGIPKDKMNEIFKPFYTTKTEGTGLGTTIIKETVEMHDGTINLKSKIGEGTIFIINLPCKEKEIEEVTV